MPEETEFGQPEENAVFRGKGLSKNNRYNLIRKCILGGMT